MKILIIKPYSNEILSDFLIQDYKVPIQTPVFNYRWPNNHPQKEQVFGISVNYSNPIPYPLEVS